MATEPFNKDWLPLLTFTAPSHLAPAMEPYKHTHTHTHTYTHTQGLILIYCLSPLVPSHGGGVLTLGNNLIGRTTAGLPGKSSTHCHSQAIPVEVRVMVRNEKQ